MYKYRTLIIAVLVFLGATAGRAQSTFYTANEYGLAIGATQYFGDLNENYGFKTVSPAYGAYVRRRMNSYIALKLSGFYTSVGYDDKFNSAPYKQLRNLNFKSNILEVSAQAEFNFFKFITGDRYYRFTPYLTGGVGLFYFDPYTTYRGHTYYLRPLGTEGQNAGYNDRKYGKYAFCFPIGAGIKYWLFPKVNLSFEIVDRLTTTDYLDDVSATYVGTDKFPRGNVSNPAIYLQDRSIELTGTSELGRAGKQRGNSASSDQYLMAVFSISLNFNTYKCPADQRRELIRSY